jgi:hypothetical protein
VWLISFFATLFFLPYDLVHYLTTRASYRSGDQPKPHGRYGIRHVALAIIAIVVVGCAPTSGGMNGSCGGSPPGPVCDGMCRSFACGDPVCTPRCGTTCYSCAASGAWEPAVTDCFCHDAGPDAFVLDAQADAP